MNNITQTPAALIDTRTADGVGARRPDATAGVARSIGAAVARAACLPVATESRLGAVDNALAKLGLAAVTRLQRPVMAGITTEPGDPVFHRGLTIMEAVPSAAQHDGDPPA